MSAMIALVSSPENVPDWLVIAVPVAVGIWFWIRWAKNWKEANND